MPQMADLLLVLALATFAIGLLVDFVPRRNLPWAVRRFVPALCYGE